MMCLPLSVSVPYLLELFDGSVQGVVPQESTSTLRKKHSYGGYLIREYVLQCKKHIIVYIRMKTFEWG